MLTSVYKDVGILCSNKRALVGLSVAIKNCLRPFFFVVIVELKIWEDKIMKQIVMIFVMVMGCVMGVMAQRNPIYNNGVQFEFEVGGLGGSLALSYKYAQRFSFGTGFWYGVYPSSRKQDQIITTERTYYRPDLFTEDKYPRIITTTDFQRAPISRPISKFFLNGQFRPSNKVFSFVFGANAGMEIIKLKDYWEPHYGDSQTVPFITPYTGFSVRMRNANLALKVGWEMAGTIKSEGYIEKRESIFYNYFENTNIYLGYGSSGSEITKTALPDVNLSTIYIALNFTYTLDFGHSSDEKIRIAEYRAEHPKRDNVKKERSGRFWDIFGGVMGGVASGLEAVSETLGSNASVSDVSGETGSYSGSSSSTSSSSGSGGVCTSCHGKKYESQSFEYAAASRAGVRQPYHHYGGSGCPYCKKSTEHYHYPCSHCLGTGKE